MSAPTIDSLKRKLKNTENQLKLVQRITETISYNLNIDEVLSEVVALVSNTMKADSCLIYLAEDQNLILKASRIPHPRMINKVAMKFGEGITGWVAREKKLVALKEQSYNDKRFKIVPDLDEDRWEAFISIPILFNDVVVGVINVQNRRKRVYSKNQVDLLKTIASQIGGALSNAKLISETRALKQALETRKVVEKAKGLLMKHHGVTEDEAYNAIRKKSMNSKKTMKEIAEAIVLGLQT